MRASLTILIYVFLVYAAPARALTPCAEIYEKLSEQMSDKVLSTDERAQIAKLFADTSLKPDDMARKAFELYLEARLRLLPPEMHERVRRLVAKAKFPEAEVGMDLGQAELLSQLGGTEIGSLSSAKYYDSTLVTAGKIYVWTFDDYRHSVLTYHSLTHELEHGIQDIARRDGAAFDTPKGFGGKDGEYEHFLQERQAIMAEWNLMNAIPESVREEAAQKLEKDPRVHPNDKVTLLRWIRNASLPLEEYLAKEYEADRYSTKQIAQIAKGERLQMILAGLFVGVGGGGMGLSVYCSGLRHEFPPVERSTVVRAFCYPVGGAGGPKPDVNP